MAKNSKKIIEIFQVIFEKDKESKLLFEDVLISDSIKEYEAYINGKSVSVKVLQDNDTIVGIVETIRNNNIPPKKHRKRKSIGPLGLEVGEGLAYGNIFLYEKKRKILLYEVNKFGSYVYHFLECLQTCCREDNRFKETFSTKLNPILKSDQWIRMNQMNYYKTLVVEIANPVELAKEYSHKNDALGKLIDLSKTTHSRTLNCKFDVESKRMGGTGLSNRTMRDMLTGVQSLLGMENGSKNIKKLTITGYALDDEGGERLEPIDLLLDRYLKHIKLSEPRENKDLLEDQRKNQIEKLYSECVPDFLKMFGEN